MTTAPPTNKHWFRKLIHGQPHQIIGGNDDPYLLLDRIQRGEVVMVDRFVPYYDWHDGGCGEPIEPRRVRADD